MDDLKSKDDKIRRLESMLAEANEQVDKARFLDMQLHGAVAQIGREDSLKERLKQTKSHADSLSVEIQHKDKELLALQREMMDAPISKERTLSVVTLLNSEIGAHMKAIRSREESDDVVKNHEQERLKQQRQFYQTQRKNLQDRLSRLNAKSVVLSSPFDPMYVINTLKAQRKSTIAHMETLLQWLDETKEGLVREKTWFLGEWETAGNVNEASHLERIKKLFELSDHCGILESLRRNQDKAKVYSNAGGEMKMHVGD
jgi:chromosome segregation ATPase